MWVLWMVSLAWIFRAQAPLGEVGVGSPLPVVLSHRDDRDLYARVDLAAPSIKAPKVQQVMTGSRLCARRSPTAVLEILQSALRFTYTSSQPFSIRSIQLIRKAHTYYSYLLFYGIFILRM
ncbi:hypothetical protein F5Y01DRAFT_268470 [Xylaria sp. FL0043]|nr:hypothetical protein F5Y01DRAFT_268470 [Xylaria sp. FL0043]